MWSRETLLWSHRALGLALGSLLMLQAGSGAVLVFREGMLLALNRPLLAAPAPEGPTAADRVLAEVDRRFDRPAIERLVFPRGKRTAAMVYLHDDGLAGRRVIASDPVSGAVIGEISGVGLTPFVLFRLHDELLLGNAGHLLLLIEGVGLLYLVVAGCLLGRPRIHGRLRLRWHGSRLTRRLDLHRTLGLSFAVLLAFSATTGAIMQADFLAAETPRPLVNRAAANWAFLMPHLARIVRDYPGQAIEDIRIPEDRRTATIVVYARDNVRPLALDRIQVDLVTGAVLPVQTAAGASTRRRLLAWMYPLHTGKALGTPGAVIALATAFALLCMPVLGFLLWRAKPTRKRVPLGPVARVP